MKATEAKLLDFLKKSPQFVIPIYQRTYSWTEQECRKLWDDIIKSGSDDSISAHFVGSIVYVQDGLYQVSSQSQLLVIDGQQRLTTVCLLLEALARAVGDDEPFDGFSAKKIRNYYLINALEDGERRYKLLLSQTDRASLKALLDQDLRPMEESIRIEQNFKLFCKWLDQNETDFESICKGLAKLVIVDIALNRDQDDPQLIFESLNSTGLELSQADLIRNYVLMGLEPQLQTKLYQNYWRRIELNFGQEAYTSHFDAFIRHYLTIKTGEIPIVRATYADFKKYYQSRSLDVENLLEDLGTFAEYYCNIALPNREPDSELRAIFQDIRELKVDVAMPFLLELYHDYKQGILPKKDLVSALRLVESYTFRRAVCGIPTNSLNKTFATFGKTLKKERYLESIVAHFLLLPSYRRFPTDVEFKAALQNKDLYNFRSRAYWLRRLENLDRKERVAVDEYTIEHIMPQNENLSQDWRDELGPRWQEIQQTLLHTLGNLTLTGYNSEYSDRPFAQKRDMTGGFKDSPLHLNRDLGNLEHWNEDAIKQRAQRVAELAVRVWVSPHLDQSILTVYRGESAISSYTISDHPYLVSGPMRTLFETFRTQVLNLDPCVTEEVLKLYIAYKAETNFVDVVPQARRLVLIINLAFEELEDPRGLCRDISKIGRWGNGEVEVGFSTAEELPYIMSLVRQSLNKQLGNGEGR